MRRTGHLHTGRTSPGTALRCGTAVAVITAVLLGATHRAPRLAAPAHQAIAAALADPATAKGLAGTHLDRVTVTAADDRLDRVSFFTGGRIVGEVAVDLKDRVEHSLTYRHRSVPYGNWIAYQPALLVCLSALFVLTAGVAPLRRMRNLDVAMALSLLAPVVILRERFIDASVIASVPGLAYLLLRCGCAAFSPRADAPPSRPLLAVVIPSCDIAVRVRILRLILIALALVFVMVGVSSTDAVDVAYAVMEGATKLLHGVLPYGHMSGDVVHGDTYPLLSYVLYSPLALVSPVRSTWDSVDLGLAAAVAAALASAGLIRSVVAAASVTRFGGRSLEAREAGLGAAIAWLSFPPALIAVSSGTTDVALGALLLGALALWRRPALATGMLAAAGWLKLAPFALVPVWLAPMRRCQLGGALAAVAFVSAPLLILLVALGGLGGVTAMVDALSFQLRRSSPQSVSAALGIGALQPLAQGAVLGLIVAAVIRLRADRTLATDRARVAALSAAILIGLQLSAAYWTFLYLTWVLPLLCISVLGTTAPSAEHAGRPASVRAPLREALAS
ncbi:MAG: hypothetical protein M3018_03285 [Actinomycetota bacterium]|nr:hypothetical protein [Actinomycetota bacterium]